MGFFSNVKAGLEHQLQGSGVKLQLQGPAAIDPSQPSIQLQMEAVAQTEPRTITVVTVHLTQDEEEPQYGGGMGMDVGGMQIGVGQDNGMDDGFGDGMNQGFGGMNQGFEGERNVTTGRAVYTINGPIELKPGEPVTTPLDLPLAQMNLPQMMGGVIGAMERDAARMGQMQGDQMEYFIHVVAVVEGQSRKAHASHRVQILNQNQGSGQNG